MKLIHVEIRCERQKWARHAPGYEFTIYATDWTEAVQVAIKAVHGFRAPPESYRWKEVKPGIVSFDPIQVKAADADAFTSIHTLIEQQAAA